MHANLVNDLHIKSVWSHEVLHHEQLALLGCPVQSCVSIIIQVKEVAIHFRGKVLSNSKMAAHGTQVKGIASPLHWTTWAHNISYKNKPAVYCSSWTLSDVDSCIK